MAAAIGLLAFVGPASSADLPETLRAILANSPTLAAGRASVRAVEQQIPQARSNMLPRVGATLQADATTNLPLLPNGGQTTLGAALTIEQPLFQGRTVVNEVRTAELALYAAEEELRGIEQDALLEGVIAHANLWRDRAVVELADESLQVAREQLEQEMLRTEAGEGVRTAEAQVAAQLALSETRHAQATANVAVAEAEYRRVTGTEVGPVELGLPSVGLPNGVGAAVQIGLGEHPSIRVAEIRADIAALDIQIARGEMLPDVGIFGTIQTERDGLGVVTNEAMIGVRVTIPIFAGGGPLGAVRENEFLALQAEGNHSIQRSAVEARVSAAYADWQSAAQRVDLSYELLFALMTALDTIEEGAEAGVVTGLEVMRARQEVLSAQTSLVHARRDEIVSIYTLLATMGRLNASTLGL